MSWEDLTDADHKRMRGHLHRASLKTHDRVSWLVPCLITVASALAIVAAFLLSRASAAETHPCKEGFTEWLDKGEVTVCHGHLVQDETLNAYQAAFDELPAARAKVEALEAQVVNLRGQVAEERARGEALLGVCNNARGACELAKTPPKCATPGLFAKPEFSWPTGLASGFIGGVLFDRLGVGCR